MTVRCLTLVLDFEEQFFLNAFQLHILVMSLGRAQQCQMLVWNANPEVLKEETALSSRK